MHFSHLLQSPLTSGTAHNSNHGNPKPTSRVSGPLGGSTAAPPTFIST